MFKGSVTTNTSKIPKWHLYYHHKHALDCHSVFIHYKFEKINKISHLKFKNAYILLFDKNIFYKHSTRVESLYTLFFMNRMK